MRRWFVIFAAAAIAAMASSAAAINIKDVAITIPNFGKVVFGHNDHFKQEGIKDNCKACHNAIFNLRAKKRFTMADMEKGASCGACHNGKASFKLDECAKCHPTKEILFKVKDAGDAKFGHELHSGMYKCGDCHPKLYLPSARNKRFTMTDMEGGRSCGACHDDKSAFTVKENCDRCHKMQ